MTDMMPPGREGEQPNPPSTDPIEHKKTQIKKQIQGPPSKKEQGFEMTPTKVDILLGGELVAAIRLLSAINQNLAFMARELHDYIHPEDKGRDLVKENREGKVQI